MQFLLQLVIDLLSSWTRMFLALLLAICFCIVFGILAATNKKAEGIILPVIDVLQTIPILGFFPLVITFIVAIPNLPTYIGVNLAIIFLIFTSMAWNITFGVYEAVKSIPEDLKSIAKIGGLTRLQTVRSIYLPAAVPRIAYQSAISWAVGLFYLVTSEIFSTGSKNFAATNGIGVEIVKLLLAQPFSLTNYAIAILFFIVAVVLTRMLFLTPLSIYSERFSFKEEKRSGKRSKVLAFYSFVYGIISRLVPKINIQASHEMSRPGTDHEKKNVHKAKDRGLGSGGVSALVVALLLLSSAFFIYKYDAYSYVPEILSALAFSFARVWGMYLVCILIAIPVGIKIAKSKKVYVAMTVLETIASIPATILLPVLAVAILALPFGNELVALSVIFLAMIWYLLFSVVAGMRTIPDQFGELMGIFKTDWKRAWSEVYIPAILPSLVTGSITAIGGAWNALIVAEYFSISELTPSSSATAPVTCTIGQLQGGVCVLTHVGNGIGQLLDMATFQLPKSNYLLMFLAIAAMTIMVLVINKLIWQRVYRKVTSRYKIEGIGA